MAYHTFKQMESILSKKPGVTNPAGLSAYIARRTYGNKALETAAKNHTSLRGHKKLHKGKHHKQIAAFVARNKGRS